MCAGAYPPSSDAAKKIGTLFASAPLHRQPSGAASSGRRASQGSDRAAAARPASAGTECRKPTAIAADNAASAPYQPRQTIAAIASGPNRSARAVASGM